MVAYSFKARFADPILIGTKAHTIRAPRKRHARPGEALQLYASMRTKQCRLIARTVCETITAVRLRLHRKRGPISVTYGRLLLGAEAIENFARADGFVDVGDMIAFWFANHPSEGDEIDFKGFVIAWPAGGFL